MAVPSASPVAGTTSAPDARSLHRGLGVTSIVFMVVAMAAPLAVVAANVPIVISISGTTSAPVYFAAATVILTLFSVGFTRMSRHVSNAGAFYAYIQAGLGRIVGTGSATIAVVSYVLLFVGVNTYVGVAASNVLQRYGVPATPWWLWSLVSLVIVGFLGYRDIELSSRVLGVVLVLETATIVALDLGILFRGGADGLSLQSWNPAELTAGTPSLGLMFAFFSFIGFEATAVFRNEARDPDKTIPRATYIAVISIGVLYSVSAWLVVSAVGTSQALEAATADPENMVLDLAASYVAPILHDVMQVLLATSFFACALTIHNVIARYAFTLGGKRVLPSALARVHSRHGSPSSASAVVSVVTGTILLIVMVTGLDPITQIYTWFSGMATFGLVLLMTMTSAAVIAYFRRSPSSASKWQAVIAPALSFVGLGAVLVLVLVNLPLLVGTETAATVVQIGMVASFATGVIIAVILKTKAPETYRALAD